MMDHPSDGRQAGPRAGLCATCRHARVVTSARGSEFLLCQRWNSDPRFARYPRLPVVECVGYEPVGIGYAGAMQTMRPARLKPGVTIETAVSWSAAAGQPSDEARSLAAEDATTSLIR